MKQLTELDELTGKTITKVLGGDENGTLFVFADKTFAIIESESGYEDSWVRVSDNKLSPEFDVEYTFRKHDEAPTCFANIVRIELGMRTLADWAEFAARQKARCEQEEVRRKAEEEHLRQFRLTYVGGTPPPE